MKTPISVFILFCNYKMRCKKKRVNKAKLKIFAAVIGFVALFSVCAYIYDGFISQSVSEISRQYAVTEINKSINRAVSECTEEMSFTSSDFLINDSKSRIISANSVAINKLCARSAQMISEDLSKVVIPEAELNLSMLSNFFSVFGIKFNYAIDVTSVGSAEVDYETEFTSAEINRTNFKVWLNVKAQVAIVDIFHAEKLTLNRKVMIIDSVIDGDVPYTYFRSTK